jgi:hypothetical protein
MGIAEYLMDQGYVPAGIKPKTILEGQQTAGYYNTDFMANLARILEKRKADVEAEQKKQQEEFQKKVDIYKTLRTAGYTPVKAHEAAVNGDLPVPSEEDTRTDVSEGHVKGKILAKMAKGMPLTSGEQDIYDQSIKKVSLTTTSNAALTATIREKLANGEDLTPGEQKVYDETIKHAQQEDPLSQIIKAQNEKIAVKPVASAPVADKSADPVAAAETTMVPVMSPDGKLGKIPRSKLQAALKAGYKLR